jgi:hypothetical protein
LTFRRRRFYDSVRRRMKRQIALLIVIAAGAGACGSSHPAAAGLVVRCAETELAPADAYIAATFEIVNRGTAAASLGDLRFRYWYTRDAPYIYEVATCDQAAVGCPQLSATVASVVPPKTTADDRFEVAFVSGAGTIEPQASSGTIAIRVSKNDLSACDETNDYSYVPSTTLADCPHVTLYDAAGLLWGTEP